MKERDVINTSKIDQSSKGHLYAEDGRDLTIYANLMDAALKEKAMSIMANFGEIPEQAIIVDVGSGTGQLAEYIASELHDSKIYAVDLSHEMLAIAKNNLCKVNLVNDDATKLVNIPKNSVDIMYHGTIGHEINSFCGSEGIKNAVEVSCRSLKNNGKEIWRDFVKPPEEIVYLDILSESGVNTLEEATKDGFLNYSLLSTKTLFQCFYDQFKGGRAFDYETEIYDGRELIKLPAKYAQEFILRKDYTANWRQEIKEEYTYWTECEAKEIFTKSGFSEVKVIYDDNKYIRNNRFKGKIALYKKEDDLLKEVEYPTHMVVVAKKSGDLETNIEDKKINGVDYQILLDSVEIDNGLIKIGDKEFLVGDFLGQGEHKQVYELLDQDSNKVIKVVRKDKSTFNSSFTSIQQTVERQNILDEMGVSYMKIYDYDKQGPPYRYVIQEAIPKESVNAAELIKNGGLTEKDISQMAEIVNRFETGQEWQIDTNPFNWYRSNKGDHTEMVYIGGTVYHYNENWTFNKVGLLQWINPYYVINGRTQSAKIPTQNEVEEFTKNWNYFNNKEIEFWKKYLNSNIQPK